MSFNNTARGIFKYYVITLWGGGSQNVDIIYEDERKRKDDLKKEYIRKNEDNLKNEDDLF